MGIGVIDLGDSAQEVVAVDGVKLSVAQNRAQIQHSSHAVIAVIVVVEGIGAAAAGGGSRPPFSVGALIVGEGGRRSPVRVIGCLQSIQRVVAIVGGNPPGIGAPLQVAVGVVLVAGGSRFGMGFGTQPAQAVVNERTLLIGAPVSHRILSDTGQVVQHVVAVADIVKLSRHSNKLSPSRIALCRVQPTRNSPL